MISKNRTPELDVVNYVGPHTPPLFIWHNHYDRFVPTINPITMADAMQRHDLPYELHIFEEGQHGMSVGNNAPGKSLDDSPYPSVDMWVPLCENWINSLFRGSIERYDKQALPSKKAMVVISNGKFTRENGSFLTDNSMPNHQA